MAKNKKQKILFVTSSRSDFASIRTLIALVKKSSNLKSLLFVTGDHTRKESGSTYKEILKSTRIDYLHTPKGGDVHTRLVEVLAASNDCIQKFKPDLVVICGDRRESFAAAIAAHMHQVPILHLHGGDLTFGMLDDAVRHSISKMAAVHCAATPGAAKRLRQMGEEPWRVFMTGSSDVDQLKEKLPEKAALAHAGVAKKNYAVVLFNPETLAGSNNKTNAQTMMDALRSYSGDIVVIYPNNDPASDGIRQVYTNLKNPRVKTFVSLPRHTYLALLKNAEFLIGNSSSGITEAATFKTPVINLGNRQDGRDRSKNILDVKISHEDIVKAVAKVQSRTFINSLRTLRNVYGIGNASKNIYRVLKKMIESKSTQELLYKKFILL